MNGRAILDCLARAAPERPATPVATRPIDESVDGFAAQGPQARLCARLQPAGTKVCKPGSFSRMASRRLRA
jgi:hypothetical protein